MENIDIEKFENDDDVANFLQYFGGSFIGRLRPDLTRSRPRYFNRILESVSERCFVKSKNQ